MARGLSLGLILLTGFLAISNALDLQHSPRQLLGLRARPKTRFFEEVAPGKAIPEEEKNQEYWLEMAYEAVNEKISQVRNTNKAKNLILFLGDGMSLTTVTAARILKGQRKGNLGEDEVLSFEKFPYTGLSKTYCVDAQVADSACSATAYLCGVKGNIMTIGVNAHVHFNNCTESSDPANHVSSIASWAQAAGKSAGFITTTTLTHASPSGTYAHVANRHWECDSDFEKYPMGSEIPPDCMDMATQLITQEPGINFEVLMGGGMGKFLPKHVEDSFGKPGERSDNINLLDKWQELHPQGHLVTNRDDLLSANLSEISHLMGIFQSGLMDYHLKADDSTKPTLAEMTKMALEKLSANPNGYFIFIEGGLIDYGSHDNKATITLDETLEFEKAIQVARDMTDPEETLIVVTSDHAHPLSISGYPARGNDILGLNENDVDINGVKYMTLNYATGPENYYNEKCQREDLTEKVKDHDPDFVYPSYIARSDGDAVHGGEDVGIFASGPFEHLFTGSMQQNTIPHLMAYAACIGDGPSMCDETK